MENAWDIMETYFWDEKSGLYMVGYISLTYKKHKLDNDNTL